MYGYGSFRTDQETPTLEDCLTRARADIEDLYKVRAKLLNAGVMFEDEWDALCDEVSADDHAATRFDDGADLLRTMGALPEFYALIRVPIVLWLEAQKARHANDRERAWSALVRCNYYLGMCGSHETMREQAARGGRNSAGRTAPLKRMVLEKLAGMADKSQETKQDVWAQIVPAMETFSPPEEVESEADRLARMFRSPLEIYRDSFDRKGTLGKSKHGKSTNPKKLLQDWTNKDPEIRSEFERVVKAGLNTRSKRATKTVSAIVD